MRSVFTSDFAEHDSVFGQFFNVSALFCMRDGNRAVTHFHIIDTKVFADRYVFIKLVADEKGLKQSAAEINGKIERPVQLQFIPEIWRHIRSTEAKFYNVNVRVRNTQEILRFIQTKPFIHHHGNTGYARPFIAVRHLREIKIHAHEIFYFQFNTCIVC
jgi:hypothetical protein